MNSGQWLSQETPERLGQVGAWGRLLGAGRLYRRAGLRQDFLVTSNNNRGVSDGHVAATTLFTALPGGGQYMQDPEAP